MSFSLHLGGKKPRYTLRMRLAWCLGGEKNLRQLGIEYRKSHCYFILYNHIKRHCLREISVSNLNISVFLLLHVAYIFTNFTHPLQVRRITH